MRMGPELAVVDGTDGTVCHVFERGDEGRAVYNYMTRWIEKNWSGDFSGMWERAKEAWDQVSTENKMYLWSIETKNEQNFKDIKEGLLATLHGYQGGAEVKNMFEEALKDLEY